MKNTNIINALEEITPTKTQKDRMLKKVLASSTKQNSRNSSATFSIASISLALAAVMGVAVIMPKYISAPPSQNSNNSAIVTEDTTDTTDTTTSSKTENIESSAVETKPGIPLTLEKSKGNVTARIVEDFPRGPVINDDFVYNSNFCNPFIWEDNNGYANVFIGTTTDVSCVEIIANGELSYDLIVSVRVEENVLGNIPIGSEVTISSDSMCLKAIPDDEIVDAILKGGHGLFFANNNNSSGFGSLDQESKFYYSDISDLSMMVGMGHFAVFKEGDDVVFAEQSYPEFVGKSFDEIVDIVKFYGRDKGVDSIPFELSNSSNNISAQCYNGNKISVNDDYQAVSAYDFANKEIDFENYDIFTGYVRWMNKIEVFTEGKDESDYYTVVTVWTYNDIKKGIETGILLDIVLPFDLIAAQESGSSDLSPQLKNLKLETGGVFVIEKLTDTATSDGFVKTDIGTHNYVSSIIITDDVPLPVWYTGETSGMNETDFFDNPEIFINNINEFIENQE